MSQWVIAHSFIADQKGCFLYQSIHGDLPLEMLQFQQELTRFSRTVRPPWALGMT